ncbi:hypothetical protein F4818DRAFT_457677 [Hypoxylon cercidicola]|nr:hypothetical protein F4818DRAFT_457677 [Hypoxylon cercidicola]
MGALYEYWQLSTVPYSKGLPCFTEQEVVSDNHDSDEDDMYLFDIPKQQPPDPYPNHKFADQLTVFALHYFLPELLLKAGPCGVVRSSPRSRRESKRNKRDMYVWGGDEANMQFACPFYVRDPEKYLSCLTRSALQEITEVKQHLWEAHRLPRYCPTCREIFTTTRSCDSHIRSRSCSPQDIPRPEGITIEQMQQLARRAGSQLSAKQQWLSLWAIVFPGADFPDAKYPSRAVEFAVCLFRGYWSSNGEKVMLDFIEKSVCDYELLDEGGSFAALHAAVLHQTIDRLVEYFGREDYDGMFAKAERILASWRHRDWISL